jgi:hypothetical protein
MFEGKICSHSRAFTSRLDETTLLDVSDADVPVGLNLVETPSHMTIRNMAIRASFLSHAFSRIWDVGTATPRLMMVLRAVCRTLLENPAMTMAEAGLLLTSDTARAKLVANLSTALNQETIAFWEGYNRRSQRDKDELVASCLNKISAFLDEPMIRHIVGQTETSIDFRNILDGKKILLVSLSPLAEEASNLLGSVLLSRLLMAVFSRADVPQDKRLPCFLFADEWHRYANADVATLLQEARKFSLATAFATQSLEMLPDSSRAAALQAGTLVVFRVPGGEDSRLLGSSFDATPQPVLAVGDEPVRAVVADPLAHLVRHSHPHKTVAAFVAQYLLPLESLVRQVSADTQPFRLGGALLVARQVLEGQRLLNAALSTCLRQGTPDVNLPPLSLLVLAGATDERAADIFVNHLIYDIFDSVECKGFDAFAHTLGRPDYLATCQALETKRKELATKPWWERFGNRLPPPPPPSFVRMLQALRETMAILAKEPLMTNTGLYQPKYQLRTYADQANLIANEITTLKPFHAKVRVLGREHVIHTLPPPSMVSEDEIDKRMKRMKTRMLRDGECREYREVVEEIRTRHELLRTPGSPTIPQPGQTNGTGRRIRRKVPPSQT